MPCREGEYVVPERLLAQRQLPGVRSESVSSLKRVLKKFRELEGQSFKNLIAKRS